MKDLSYQELVWCQTYAKHVLSLYKKTNNGKTLDNASDADLAVREYNKEIRRFKDMFGVSIRKYIPTIVETIGFMVESEEMENDGWEELNHSPDSNYTLYRKVLREGNGKVIKGIWKVKHIRTGKIKDITYDQALGYEPIEDTPIKRLSRELGRMLLPQR